MTKPDPFADIRIDLKLDGTDLFSLGSDCTQKCLIVVANYKSKVRGNAQATMQFWGCRDMRTKEELLCWAAVVQLLKVWRCGEFGMFCGQWTVTV